MDYSLFRFNLILNSTTKEKTKFWRSLRNILKEDIELLTNLKKVETQALIAAKHNILEIIEKEETVSVKPLKLREPFFEQLLPLEQGQLNYIKEMSHKIDWKPSELIVLQNIIAHYQVIIEEIRKGLEKKKSSTNPIL